MLRGPCAVVLAALFVSGCGAGEPIIKELVLDRYAAFLDGVNEIHGKFEALDYEKDASQGIATLTGPDGVELARSRPHPLVSRSGPDNQSAFTVSFTYVIAPDCLDLPEPCGQPRQAGKHKLTVWLVDVAGHESNRLSAEIRID